MALGIASSMNHFEVKFVFKYCTQNMLAPIISLTTFSGSFNNWQKMKMSRSTKDFVAIVDLKEGEHEYKFLGTNQ